MAHGPWTIRVVKRDGTVVTENLPHLSSTAQVFGFQKANNAPSSQLGRAKISLLPPRSPEGVAAAYVYSLLEFGQRLEILIGGVGAIPVWSGIIERITQDFPKYELDCVDSMYIAQQGSTSRQEDVTGTADSIFTYAIQDFSMLYGDDFATLDLKSTDAGNPSYTQFVQAGSAQSWTAVTVDGDTAAQIVTSAADATARYVLYNPTQYTSTQYRGCYIMANFTQTYSGAGLAGDCGIVWAFNSGNNHFMTAEINLSTVGATRSTVPNPVPCTANLHFSQFTPGGSAVKTIPIPAGYLDANGQYILDVQMAVQINWDGVNYNYRILINGQDLGAIYLPARDGALIDPTPTGGIGFYVSSASSALTTVCTNLYMDTRQPIFVAGTVATGTKLATHKFNQASLLDVMNVAAGMEGYTFRKTPKQGWNNDVLDFGNLGATTNVRFSEGQNIISLQLSPNNEKPASEITMQGAGGADNPRIYRSRNLAAIRKYGKLSRQVNWEDVNDFRTIRKLGKTIATFSATTGQAKTLDIDDTVTDGLWRELDYIIVNAPSLGLVDSIRQVIGYEMSENSPIKKLYLDQYSMNNPLPYIKRLQQQIDNVVGGALQVSRMTSSDGRSFLDLTTLNRFVSNDGTYDRAEAGHLSTGGYGFISRDAAGNVLFDSTAFIAVKQVAEGNVTANGTLNAGNGQVVPGTQVSFTITSVASKAALLYIAFASAKITAGAGIANVYGTITGPSNITGSAQLVDSTGVGWINLAPHMTATGLGSGTYTMQLVCDVPAGCTIQFNRGNTHAFVFGQ